MDEMRFSTYFGLNEFNGDFERNYADVVINKESLTGIIRFTAITVDPESNEETEIVYMGSADLVKQE